MINFLKKLFKKEELLEEQVYSDSLLEWFEKNCSEISSTETQKIRAIFESIKQNQRSLAVEAKKLGVAEIKGNLLVKEFQIAEGNKEVFAKQLEDFSKSIETPDMVDYVFVSEYTKNFEKIFNEFTKSTFKHFYVTQQFLKENIGDISDLLKNLEKDLANLKEITNEKSSFSRIAKTRNLVKEFLKSISNKRKVSMMMEEEQKKLQINLEYKRKIEEEKASLTGSSDYENALNLMQKKKDLEKQLNIVEAGFISKIDVAGKLLKKVADVSVGEVNLLGEYLEKPYLALKNDSELKILQIINKVTQSVENNSIPIEEKKKQKVVEHLNNLNRENLMKFRDDCSNIKSNINEVSGSINNNTTLTKIEDINYKIEHTDSQIEKITDEINKFNKYIEKLEYYEIKEEIEKEVQELLNAKVSILIDDES